MLKERENLGGKRTREPSARVNREAQGVIGARLRLVCPGSGSGWLAGQPAYKHVPRFASKVNDDRPVIGLRAQAFFRFVAFALSANATVLAMRVYEPLSIELSTHT